MITNPIRLFPLMFLIACADQPTVEPSPRDLGTRTTARDNCDVDAGYQLDVFKPATGTLQVVGIYEARNKDAVWWAEPGCMACLEDPECDVGAFCDPSPKEHPATVRVDATTTTLVLASYEPTRWTVTADAGAVLQRIIVSSYEDASTAVAPEGVTVEVANLGFAYEWFTDEELAQTCQEVEDEAYCDAFGDHWQSERAAAALDAKTLIQGAEALSGDKLGAFHGCYSMSSITVGASR